MWITVHGTRNILCIILFLIIHDKRKRLLVFLHKSFSNTNTPIQLYTSFHRSNQTIISLMYTHTHTGAALSYRISLDLGRINIISPRVLSPAIPQVLPSASPPASRPRDIRDALIDVYIQAWTCNESATRARTARFAGATGMRGTRRVFSRSDSRALTLLLLCSFFFLQEPGIKPSLKKKIINGKIAEGSKIFFSFFFFGGGRWGGRGARREVGTTNDRLEGKTIL